MKVLILGGGAQGKAALYDLSQNKELSSIKVVENNLPRLEPFVKKLNDDRIEIIKADANDDVRMRALIKESTIVIDLLPTFFRKEMTRLAIKEKVNIVNTSFMSNIKELGQDAFDAEIMIMPEAGLDPGIDLILAGDVVRRFDNIEAIYSSCGGVPTKEACTNPLNYKVSWNFEGVLSAYRRPASLVINNEKISIDPDNLFDYCEEVEIEGIGKMERYPNGFSTTYAHQLGIREEVENVGRFTLRWPGHCSFWKKMSLLGLLSEDECNGVSPKKWLADLLEPKLQYRDDEQDLVVLRNEVIGIKDGQRKKVVQQMIDKRDLKTGLMAMNRTVGFTASIIAQMILYGKIKGKGMMNPAQDVPYKDFVSELKKRNIKVEDWEEEVK